MNEQACHWECPCGQGPPSRAGATPTGTFVSLREPVCPFCGRVYKPEYERVGRPERLDGAEA